MLYLFEDYVLDTDRRELRRAAALLSVEPKVFDLLAYVVHNRARVVTKDDLIAAIWGGHIISDSALATRLNAARTAIDDSGQEQRLIKTLPRKGIRFVGAVREQEGPTSVIAESSGGLSKTILAQQDKPSIAVLPFANVSGEPEQEYFADGLTDDIITELSRFAELLVIARNSSFQYKGKSADIRQIGRELGVRYVLEGSLRRRGERVRIAAQLVDAESGRHRWADRYDCDLSNVFEVHDEVASTIAAVLSAHVNRAEAERVLLKPPASWQAYDYFLQAAHIYNSEAKDRNCEARNLAARAIELDPHLARGYLIIASTLVRAWVNHPEGDDTNELALDEAHDFATKAVQIEPRLPQARAMLGYVLSRMGQHDAAIAEFSRAIERNPNYTDWRYLAALVLAGATQQALQVSLSSMRLDPFYPAANAGWVGLAHYMAKRYSEGVAYLREAIARAPVFRYGHLWLAATYARQGQIEQARARAAEVLRIDPQWTNEGKGRTIYRFKNPEDVEHLLEGLRRAGLPDHRRTVQALD